MLTADHVRASKKKGELVLRPLTGELRTRALELARSYVDLVREHVGQTRDDLRQAVAAVPVAAREKKLADGLLKLLDDACEFTAESGIDPAVLRKSVFMAAAERRKNPAPDALFDRRAVLSEVGAAHGLTAEQVDASLFSDLRGAHVLLRLEPLTPEALVSRYEDGQVQAVLLRAVRVLADVECRSAAGYRYLFRQLKFRRLLHRITPSESGGYRIEIDGPYSLFDSVTKYGLALALALPALKSCDRLTLVADVRWGKAREPLVFRLLGGAGAVEASQAHADDLPEEVAALAQSFTELGTQWSVARATDLLDLPGVGLCVPDLVFAHPRLGKVHFEALGFWSRDAVWKRVELVEGGLPARILFAVSERLRVSESVLSAADHAALYVYKGSMSARAVLRKLERIAETA